MRVIYYKKRAFCIRDDIYRTFRAEKFRSNTF